MLVGIDNGISGGLVALSDSSQIVGMMPMPIQKARKGNEVDVERIWDWLDSMGDRSKLTVIVEEPCGSKSAKACASMAGSFHSIRALLVIKGIRFHRVTPQSWQKAMLPGCKAGDSKPRALTVARQLWPDEDWLASDRCKVPHDGLVDAALISEYGRLKL